MEKILESFGVQPILLAAQAVNFLILLFLLNKFLYKPVLKVLEERKLKIAQSLKDAEAIELKLKKTEEEREKKLSQAAKEAQELINDSTKEAAVLIENAHIKASEEIQEMLSKAKNEIVQEREQMHQEMRNEVADLIVLSLEKITGKMIDKKDQKTIVEMSVKDLK